MQSGFQAAIGRSLLVSASAPFPQVGMAREGLTGSGHQDWLDLLPCELPLMS